MNDWTIRMARRRRQWLRREWETAVADSEQRPRAWWRREAVRTGTTMSALLRQRARVRWWINAGRPPLAEWTRRTRGEP